MRRQVSTALLVSVLAMTSACTTMGTNVSGSFRCDAPDGVCAPSLSIDDQALSEITQADASELMAPAGPYKIDDGDGGRAQLANAQSVMTTQNQPYKLSIVFPAYTDVAGTTHQRRAVTANVGLPGRTASSVELAGRSRGRHEARGLLAAAQSAPALISMNTPEAPPQSAQAGAPPMVGAAAVDRIKAEVDAKLAPRAARRQAASFPSPE